MADFFNDLFTDADATTLVNHTTDVGNAQYTGHTFTRPESGGTDLCGIWSNALEQREPFFRFRPSSVSNPEQFDAYATIRCRNYSNGSRIGFVCGYNSSTKEGYFVGIRHNGTQAEWCVERVTYNDTSSFTFTINSTVCSFAFTVPSYTNYNVKFEVRTGGFFRILADAEPAAATTERCSGTDPSPIATAGVFGLVGHSASSSPPAGATLMGLRAEQFGASAQPFNLGSLSLQTVGRSTLGAAGGVLGFGSALKYWRVPTNAHPAVGNLQVVVMSSDAGHPTVQAGAVTPDQNGALFLLCSDQGVTTGEKRLAAVHDNTGWDTTATQMKGGIGIATVVEV